MKKLFSILSAAILLVTASLSVSANAATVSSQETTDSKTLVAYFSHSGNTQSLANIIHGQVGGDLFRIVPTDAYPSDYDATVERGRREMNQAARPALSTSVEDMSQYDTVYLGYPIWFSTIPMPVATFLEAYDFSGKTVIPFCTHGGSGSAGSESAIKALIPQATVLSGLEIRGNNAANEQTAITTWLSGLQIPTANAAATGTEITITAGDTVISATLNNTRTARDIAAALPMTISAKDWKEKAFYGRVRREVSTEGTQHYHITARDIVYWIDGEALMLYYDETKDTNITTPVITVGSITSDLDVFAALDNTTEIRVALKS